MKKNIFIFIIVLITASSGLLAVSVRNYNIAPLNRVNIFFDSMPAVIEGELSDDKKTLSINLGEVDFTAAQQFITGEGIIRKVELIKKNKNTFLNLSLADARGFTVAKFPYSIGLVVEVFDWKKLDSVEEAYRMGLLSLIDNEIELAEPDLLKGVNGGIADAGFFLGSIYFDKGKINTALKMFRFADLKKTTINDNYVALSHIYTHKNQNAEAEKYAKIYKTKTGSNTLPAIQFPTITEKDDLSDAIPSVDSALNFEQNLVDIMPEDTTEIDSAKVDSNDTTAIKKDEKKESIWAAENYLLTKYAVGIAVALVLLVIYLYLKWRNKQLQTIQNQQTNKANKQTSIKSKNKTDFNKIMEEKIKEQKPAVPISKPLKKTKQQTNSPPPKTSQKQTKPPSAKPDYKKNADMLVNLADKIKREDNVIKSDSILKAELEASNFNANRNSKPINRMNTANVDLASRLLIEQKKLKQEKLSNLSSEGKLTPDKIDEVAKKIGVDKGSLETKHSLENLLQNKEELKKLREKFGG